MVDAPTTNEQREFYNEFWSSYPVELGGWETRRLAEVLNALSLVVNELRKPPLPKRICDLGCGRGWLASELQKFGRVTGVDLSPEGIALARKMWPNFEFEATDILTWRPGAVFDVVVSSEVIEHILEKERFVDTIYEILRPGGYAVVTTPNGLAKRAFDRMQPEQQMVEAWSTPRELKGLFEDRFTVLKHEVFGADLLYSGLYRFRNSPKIRKTVKSLGVNYFYDALWGTLHMGLFQIIMVQKR